MRLARFLAQAGVASRRKAEDIIRSGAVLVNQKKVTDVATTVTDADVVTYNGAEVRAEPLVYYVLHKPIGYVCSAQDAHNDRLVIDLVPKKPRVVPVGRLDKDTSGLLLLTNDGDTTYALTHPKHEIQKVYEVTTTTPISKSVISGLTAGVRLAEGLATVDSVEQLSPKQLRMTIHQGWNRQIRRMLEALDCTVETLQRVQEGTLTLGDLNPGEYRTIEREEIEI